MTSERVETNVGTGLKCRTFGSLALTLAKLLQSGRAVPHPSPFLLIFPHSSPFKRSNLQGLFSNYTKKRYANLYNCDYFYIFAGEIKLSYQDLMARLSAKQKVLLIALARSGRDVQPTSGAFIKKYHLTSASAVQRSLSALQDKDIVTNSNGQYFIYDYFLFFWLNKE